MSTSPMAKTATASRFEVPSHIAEQVEIKDGAQAIEVSALFEDAVQVVRHLDNPSAGKVSRLTRGLIGSAAASLAGVMILFTASYSEVAAEKAKAESDYAAGAHHKRSDGRAKDYGAAGLFLYGATALFVGLQRRMSERKENEFTIGDDAQATFQTAAKGLPLARFPLVRSTGTEYELLFTKEMQGDVQVDGKTVSLTEYVAAGNARPAESVGDALVTRIPQNARFCLHLDNTTYLVNSVARPRHYPVPMQVNWGTQSYTGAVLAGVGVFLGLMFSVPPDPKSLALDSFLNEHLVRFMVKPQEQETEKANWLDKVKKEATNGGKAAKGPEGRAGKQDAPKVVKALQVSGPKNNPDPQLNRAKAIEIAKTMGVVGVLSAQKNPMMASIFSRDSALGGQDAQDVLGNLAAVEQAGDAYGNNGMGLVGAQRGGPGTQDGTIGLGKIGGVGTWYGKPGRGGPPGSELRKHVVKDITDVGIGPATVVGSLDKDVIRRVIRRHMNEVKFCYEKELSRNQGMEGRVQIAFTIGMTGAVAASVVQSSTLNNMATEQCIAGAIRRWEFPRPQAGIVQVAYPFVLKTAEQ